MKKLKIKKGYVAGLLTLFLAAAGLHVASAYATNVIDPAEPCTLTLSVPKGEEYTEELNGMELHTKIYQVATVDAAGEYSETSEFKSLSVKDAVNGDVTWEEMTAKAAELASDKTPDTDCTITDGTGEKELNSGIYLVVVESASTGFYEYNFNPGLIALPDNQALHSAGAENKWIYEVKANLKPERSPRYGSLLIQKNLDNYNETMKEVTFVFSIEAVDENGNIVDGDKIMFIVGKYLLEQGKLAKDTVVTTVMSNLGFHLALEEAGMNSVVTAVGDRYVVEEMRKNNYNFGGEQSGHMVFLDYNTTGDGQLSAIQLVKVMRETGKKLSELAAEVTIYPQKLVNVRVANNAAKEGAMDIPAIRKVITDMEEKMNGKGRILVRPSGTEPLLRVMAEAPTDEEVNEVVDTIVDVVKEEIGVKL